MPPEMFAMYHRARVAGHRSESMETLHGQGRISHSEGQDQDSPTAGTALHYRETGIAVVFISGEWPRSRLLGIRLCTAISATTMPTPSRRQMPTQRPDAPWARQFWISLRPRPSFGRGRFFHRRLCRGREVWTRTSRASRLTTSVLHPTDSPLIRTAPGQSCRALPNIEHGYDSQRSPRPGASDAEMIRYHRNGTGRESAGSQLCPLQRPTGGLAHNPAPCPLRISIHSVKALTPDTFLDRPRYCLWEALASLNRPVGATALSCESGKARYDDPGSLRIAVSALMAVRDPEHRVSTIAPEGSEDEALQSVWRLRCAVRLLGRFSLLHNHPCDDFSLLSLPDQPRRCFKLGIVASGGIGNAPHYGESLRDNRTRRESRVVPGT